MGDLNEDLLGELYTEDVLGVEELVDEDVLHLEAEGNETWTLEKWLASLDAPSWGTQAAAATAPSEPAAVQAEQAAAAAAEAEAAKAASLPSLSHTVHRPRASLHAFREARRRG